MIKKIILFDIITMW